MTISLSYVEKKCAFVVFCRYYFIYEICDTWGVLRNNQCMAAMQTILKRTEICTKVTYIAYDDVRYI